MADRKRDGWGTFFGLVTFLGGVGLVVATFFLAQGMFSVTPEVALGIKSGETLDVNRVAAAAIVVLVKVLLLIVMAGLGSIVASRGIKLYVSSGTSDKSEP